MESRGSSAIARRRDRWIVLAAALIAFAAAAAEPIVEYQIPTRMGFPHDPAVARDGIVYFTEMAADKIGRFDPATSEFKEYRVPTRNAGPHGLVVDDAGRVVFTEIRSSKIGRLDPNTGTIHEFSVTGADGPHTPLLAPDGKLYFTASAADAIAELDLASGALTVVAVPTPYAVPYGIKLGPDGAIYFTEFGASKIGQMEPGTRAITEFTTPTPDSAPRRLWFSGTDLFFTEFSAGHLGRLRPATGAVKEWMLPDGAESRPYGIAVDAAGEVWIAESGNGAMVRFDPKSEQFTARLMLPSSNAVVRNMDVAPDGRIWMALSGMDRIGVITAPQASMQAWPAPSPQPSPSGVRPGQGEEAGPDR